eukprot:scaffold221048_cov25-Tisochrysis_lutea.AAC.1
MLPTNAFALNCAQHAHAWSSLAETLAPGSKRILGLSKKDELLRRKELLGPAGSSSSLATALTSTCAERAGAFLRTAHAADVVVEVARGGTQ